jgi:hypothetical protein
MSAEAETNPQPTTSSPEPGSAADWGAPEPGEKRLPPPEREREPDPPPHVPDPPPVEGGDDEPAQVAADDDDPIGADEPEEGDDDTPDFWAKEDKEFWKQVPPELKPILQKYEKQRIEFANKKAEEAAAERKAAMEEAKKAHGANEQYAQWWAANEQTFTKTFVDRWAGVDWNKLAEENPAEWARLSQQRANEHQMLTQAKQQAVAAQTEAAKRAKAAEQQARLTEHGKLAKMFPKEFGEPKAAERTYAVLSKYLIDEGVPPETVSGIYDSTFVKLARKAYKYDQLQAKAKGITDHKPSAAPASTTPMRVVPGARNSANPVNDATRQALERLKSGEPLTREDAGLAFR